MRSQRLAHVSLPDYVPKNGRHNGWGFDPDEQRTRTYLGMGEEDINLHDQWAVESMGAIQDRTREHLGTSDKVIMANRRTLLKAIETVRDGGTPPMVLTADARPRCDRARHDRLHRAGAGAGRRSGSRRAAAKRAGAAWLAAPANAPTPHDAGAALRRARSAQARRRATQAPCAAAAAPARRAASSRCASPGADLHGSSRAARRWSAATPSPRALRRRHRHGQHDAAEGHVRPHRVQGVRARRAGALAGLRRRQQPAAAARPGQLRSRCRGRRAPAGCAPSPGSTTAAPVPLDPRRVLQRALARAGRRRLRAALRARGRVPHLPHRATTATGSLDPERAAWPAEPPALRMLHPGYNLLAEAWADLRRRRAGDRAAHRAGAGPAAAVARDRARAEPVRGGVRRRPTR